MSKLGKLSARIQEAEKAMQQALERDFPVLSLVEFYIQHGQVNKSTGEVVGYTGGRNAYLRVRLNSRARTTRDVPAWNCRILRPASRSSTGRNHG